MNDQVIDAIASQKCSTYSLLFAKNILNHFDVHMNESEIINALQNESNIYFHLLRVPYKHVFNGIILEQAQEYRIYTQKLFVDYLLSGANDDSPDSPGSDLRDQLENERCNFIELGKKFDELVMKHEKLIAETQKQLIQMHNDSVEIQDIKSNNIDFIAQTGNIKTELYDYRNKFYATILHIRSMLQSLPNYKLNLDKNSQNQIYLQFNPDFGKD